MYFTQNTASDYELEDRGSLELYRDERFELSHWPLTNVRLEVSYEIKVDDGVLVSALA